ncbi:MAG: hypothetical protein AAFN18_23620 [Cyanobacteria bacterium J06554_6]
MPDLKTFHPSQHGFRFPNRFAYTDVADALPLDSLEVKVPPLSGSYGLCGGMSAAVADYYASGHPIPPIADIPKPGESLYRYLVKRQRHTLGKTGKPLARFLAWMRLSDIGLQVLTVKELDGVLNKLNRGKFAVLGLVHVGKGGKPWDNHQVLAYDYEQKKADTLRIKVYEPNAPLADDAYIEVTRTQVKLTKDRLAELRSVSVLPASLRTMLLRIPAFFPDFLLPTIEAVTCHKHRGNAMPVRGFFQMPYTPQVPPLISDGQDRINPA